MNATPPPPPSEPPSATKTDALRFAFGALTVLPVGTPRWDRAAARGGMLAAPLAGAAIGLAGALVSWMLLAVNNGRLVAAVVAVAVMAVLSRGLHLDGLADVADGLGSGRPADEALVIMKRSDIGPFGVVTLVFTLLAQTAALAELAGHGHGHAVLGALLAGLVSRTALTWACREGVPAARPEGLGAAVAGVVTVPTALAVAGAAAAVAGVAGSLTGDPAVGGVVVGCCAVVLALSAAELLIRHCRRRFGGITGDVLGAVAETAATVTLLVLTVGAT
ncbi:adenosylcobinamide-GDP ribazoletransferase [Streptomyces sp. NBC_01803]|uniref:adenosylcobinamide-GDP ribazoletransferase n=1 Tax=Streptomyces sp. NBC_01803 TaxID=2975946 RepID=UPI002DD910D5|nr:adenosylcobinamide-GDP ribazoletransferase [Streptomyces sp. NBC_01803]WSA46587.1 adenosylcobinamide-GDP ribazoletransferase [Streptomyces sp. NBC_01803]